MDGSPTPISRHARLRRPADTAVRWTGGFWAEKQDLVRTESIISVLDAMEDPENAAWFGNFRAVAAGGGTFRGRYWSDGDCYKALESILLLTDVSPDAGLTRRLDAYIETIAAAQEDDGYLNTQITLTDLGRWTDIEHHEMYNLGHLFTTACLHHQVTGTRQLLDIAIRAADNLHDTFTPRDPDLARFGFNPSQIMGLVELYRETGEARYLALARLFVENRGAHPDRPGNNGDQSQARVPLLDETEAVGHAVTGPYLWAGAADIVMETDEAPLMAAITRIWEDSTFRKMYITGGIGALHKGTSERSHPRYEQIAEAYGRPYQLPSDTAYNETCANIANAMWSWRMLQLTGEARYADVIEQVMYNTGLSGLSLSGTHFTYSNPLRFNGATQFIGNNDSPRRWTRWTCYCCPPQVTRTIAGLHRWAYSTAGNAVWVHLYGSNTLDTGLGAGRIALRQVSEFPWSGDVRLCVEDAPDSEVTLHLRIPGWSAVTSVRVNGEQVDATGEGPRYLALTRRWTTGDQIDLTLDLRPRILAARPEVEEVRNQVAVMAGPVVYCLEGADLPEGVTINEVALPADATFKTVAGEGLFAGITLLRTAMARRAGWSSPALYAPLVANDAGTLPVTLIPYFAWNNRDDNTMAVWLPLKG
ncbi:glycoside hydrolase family 127 protein [Marinovum sp.]|uniref:glycoside hydrolase family 127 protein n=1 Tax=Marinovum sp. TaxID=2024839 RepID=UPI002B27491A|nr:beta-L-arabinofuranosidase domain-containing protein [Marinovum sp.]